MRLFFLSFAFAFAVIPIAAADNCDRYAQGCIAKGGAKDRCFGSAYTACKSTGTYIGPYSGRVFTGG